MTSLMLAYRSFVAPQSSQYSPFFLLYGRECWFPLDIVLVSSAELGRTINEHIEDFLEKLEFVHDIAKENIQLAQKKYKHQHDKKAKEPGFYAGQRVWLYNPATPQGSNPKMIQRWGGPYYIVLANNNHTYCLRDCKENNLHKGLVHAHRLKAYNDPSSRPTNNPLDLQETVTQDAVPSQQDLSQPDATPAQNTQDPENTPNASGPVNSHTPDSVSQEEFALVEKLLKCAMIRKKRHYLVMWANKDF